MIRSKGYLEIAIAGAFVGVFLLVVARNWGRTFFGIHAIVPNQAWF